jgi:predicted enzyme related to lactoylglutathione lyase
MGQPVVHFEVMGTDGGKLREYYSQMFGWKINADNPMNYGTVDPADAGIGGGIGQMPEGREGHVTFYVGVPDVEASLQQAESLGGSRLMGPDKVMEGVEIGLFNDPEGHTIGLFKMAAAE